jgi:DNA-binding transcriptional LysR family regulator
MPTTMAKQIAPAIRNALEALGDTLMRQRPFDPSHDVEQVTIAMHEELEALLLRDYFLNLRRSAPNLTLGSVRLDRANLRSDLASGSIDFAVDVATPTDPDLLHQELGRDAFCVVSTKTRKRLSADDYFAAEHVAVSTRRAGPAAEDFLLNRRGLTRNVVLRCLHYQAAAHIAESSQLLLTLPRRQAHRLRSFMDLRVFPLPLQLPPVEIHLYWHRKTDNDSVNLWLRQKLTEVTAGLGRGAPEKKRKKLSRS